MNRQEQDKLLNDLLAGEELSYYRQASLEHGLLGLRWLRRQRRAARMGAMILLPVLAVAGILTYRRNEPAVRLVASVPPPAPTVSAAKAEIGGVKIITDEELFALFPGRAMALVGKPGKQRLVFLDGGSAQARVQ